ncbi:SAM-dependent methyltransferase [Umezawaea sp. Da 62-37]|uniref:SAM-dependent methyltransferase n=1 Tax=Umezawaea sp. Da 62-37 TaxID=3075927 RepID=UPI0028F6C0B5|nr:SAM-dependent methyltransferase [Umezawaea sp. Da 62-37]WNV90071.1 SAM-dependent methyltransferase [Umezawaea sp. Da 62-37]
MVDHEAQLPPIVDLTRPNDARVYDYLLGGAHNFAVDRELAKQVVAAMPEIKQVALANRAFLHRVVRESVRAGVRQFLDLGSGIPGVGNVHEIAQAIDPTCRVAYVDSDPVVHAHGELILADTPNTALINADLLDAADVLARRELRDLLDFEQPIAVLALLSLHFIPESQDPDGALAAYRDAIPEGSLLALSHPSVDPAHEGNDAIDLFTEGYSVRPTRRDLVRFRRMFDGFELLEPGITPLSRWRPDRGGVEDVPVNGGLGVKSSTTTTGR